MKITCSPAYKDFSLPWVVRCASVVFLLTPLSCLALVVHWDVVCVNYELTNVVNTLCWLYMCYAFCESKSLVPDSCETWHGGKEVVFSAFFRGIPIDKSEEIF